MTTDLLSEKVTLFLSSLGIPGNPIQKAAYNNLARLDFPTTKTEYWKYTRINKIQNSRFQVPKAQLKKADPSEIWATHYAVIENGMLRDDLSNYVNSGFEITSRKSDEVPVATLQNSSVDQGHLFSALNTAYFSELIEIAVPANVHIDEPLQLLFISTGKNIIANPRVIIHAHKSSSSRVAATFISDHAENNFTNIVTEFFVDENAQLVYNKIQDENATCYHVSTEQVNQGKNSGFKLNTITLDGLLTRNNINIGVNGENGETHMNGVIIAKGNQHIDNHTFVDHKVANCFSNETYKYVLDDKSTGVFNGRVIVQQDAQKINAYQKNANILLSDFAQIYSKPELEIYADDVKCSHGSTTGQLDDNAIFYLQTRGLSKDKAKKLLVSAFIGEVLEQFSSNEQDKITSILRSKHNWDI